MRGAKEQGRFDFDYEALSMYEGIAEELGGKVGVEVQWFRWQEYFLPENKSSIVDEIYDVSSPILGQGRRWMLPFRLPVVLAQLNRGGNMMNERGFYTVDTLRLVVNAGDAKRLLPDMVGDEPNRFIKDRVVYRGQVFTPSRVNPRGAFGYRWAGITIDLVEVSPEELVNDPQFLRFALPTPKQITETIDIPQSIIEPGYGEGGYGTEKYGE